MKELLTMSNPEFDKLKVIQNVIEHLLTWPEAAAQLDLSVRQIGRLVVRVREQGHQGILHQLRGKPSNHRLDPAIIQKAVQLVKARYPDFGPTFANEKLRENHGLCLSTFTLRNGMVAEGLWTSDPHNPKHRSWRPRRNSVGELVQLDGSEHDWFEGRGPKCALVIYIDDATSRILYGQFVSVENTVNLMKTTRAYLDQSGRPVAFYVDKDSIYTINRHSTLDEQLLGADPLTQFARAMDQLDIEIINAHSPQAKGRVERGFRTHQDRLVKELRLRGISTVGPANHFLQNTYISGHNRRCSVVPANPTDAHRPVLATHCLDRILAIHHDRTVANDFTVRLNNAFFQILPDQPVKVRPKDKILIELWMDGSTHFRFKDQPLGFKPLPERPYTPFYATRKPPATCPPSRPYRSPRTHPWRDRSFQRMILRKAKRIGLSTALEKFSHPDRVRQNKKRAPMALQN